MRRIRWGDGSVGANIGVTVVTLLKLNMLRELCGKENNLVTAVCLQKFADSSPAGQPVGKPATPGIQSGMVVVETKKPSYAQVAAAIVVNFTSGLSSPPPSPRPYNFRIFIIIHFC